MIMSLDCLLLLIGLLYRVRTQRTPLNAVQQTSYISTECNTLR